MDHYRKRTIELVRNRPLLWDPSNEDYRNKEQRKLMWEEVEMLVQFPKGAGTTAKTIWNQLNRGFCNALKRKEKLCQTGAATDKEWKFHQDMTFLIPVKKNRSMVVNLDYFTHSDEESDKSYNHNSQLETLEPASEDIGTEDTFLKKEEERDAKVENEVAKQGATCTAKHRTFERKEDISVNNETKIMKFLLQLQEQKSMESPRLNFFKSIIPNVDALTDNEFLDFQIEVLKLLQRR